MTTEPDCFNVATPEPRHIFTENEIEILQENIVYHRTMVGFIELLSHEGPAFLKIPKPPKRSLKLLFEPATHSKRLTGHELHTFLVKNLATSGDFSCPRIEEIGDFIDLQSVIPPLKTGYSILKKHNSTLLAVSLDYGNWLNVAFELHSIEKLTGKVTLSWADWMNENIGISVTYAQKLREISKLLKDHRKFRQLGLSFGEIYQNRKQIQALLVLHKEYSEFWKEQ